MVVVVQLFAANEDAPRDDVRARVSHFEIAIAPVVPDAVDDARGKERDPRHLHGPDRDADRTEQN